MKVSKLQPVRRTLMVSPEDVTCGLHTLRISVPLRDIKLEWKKKEATYWVLRNKSGGISIKRKVANRYYSIPQSMITRSGSEICGGIRLAYNREPRLSITFEPLGEFEHEATDLLPLDQWLEAWNLVSDLVSKELKCEHLFENRQPIVSRFDLGFDVRIDDPKLLMDSCEDLRVHPKLAADCRRSEGENVKYRTKTGSKEMTIYIRTEKTGGVEMLRFELRNQQSTVCRRALGRLVTGLSTRPEDLSNIEQLVTYVEKSLKRYGIWPNTEIVPSWSAKERLMDRFTLRDLNNYLMGVKAERPGDVHRRLRVTYKIAIGTHRTESVASIVGLYEAFWAAFNRSMAGV
jgi:hypothetical protein